MPLSTDLPTTKADGDANHTAGHNATNTRVNDIATAVNLAAASQVVSVKDHGALGDGSTADKTAIDAAIAAVDTRSAGVVYFPAGTYPYAGKLSVPANIYLVGESPYAATIKLTGSTIATFVEFGAAATINVFGGIKGLQVDADSKASTAVKMYGPQEGSGLYETFIHGSTVTGVDAVGTGVTGGTNMFEIARSWIWVDSDTAMTGVAISGGLAVVRGTTMHATNRTTTAPAGSAGVTATDASVVLDSLNSEEWESGYRLVRSYADVRAVQTATCVNGLTTTSDSGAYPVRIGGILGWNNSGTDVVDGANNVVQLNDIGKGVRVYASSTSQTIASGVQDTVDFSATEFNDDTSLFTVNHTSNTITVTRPIRAIVTTEVSFQGGGAGYRYTALQSSVGGQLRQVGGPTDGSEVTWNSTAVLRLAAGEALHLDAYVDGGSAVTVRSDGVFQTGLAIAAVGA